MKKKMQMVLAALLLLAGAMFASANAQQSVVQATHRSSNCLLSDPYPVQQGDSLWRLRQKEWKVLIECNPYLAAKGRSFTKSDGTYVVLIKPDEVLYGVTKVGGKITPMLPSPVLAIEAPSSLPVKVANVPEKGYEFLGIPWWLPLLLAVLLGLGLWYLKRRDSSERHRREQEQNRNPARAVNTDPTTSGPPMVPGGVTEGNANEVFQRAAARAAGMPPEHYQQFTVLERTRGCIYGPMTVSCANGTTQDWNMTGQAAYQARVRFPNGHEETLYMLQACGNDLRYQGVNRYQPGEGFRFVPDPVAVPAPVTSVVLPAVPVEPNETAVEGEVKLEVKPANGDQGSMVRLTGVKPEDVTFIMNATGFTLRYKAPTTPAA